MLFRAQKYAKDREVPMASAPRLRDIKEYILRELHNWNCFDIGVPFRNRLSIQTSRNNR